MLSIRIAGRGRDDPGDERLPRRDLELPLPHPAGRKFAVEQIYPPADVGTSWTATAGEATLSLSASSPAAAAKMYRLTVA